MALSDVKKISVMGVGTIGFQIAQLMAQFGYDVVLRDIDQKFVDSGLKKIGGGLQKFFVDKGRMTKEEADATMGRLKGAVDLSEAANDADIIIEAIPERLNLKQNLFKDLDTLCPEKTIFASNTSALMICEVGALTKRKDKLIGMHFSNPVLVMRLVEIIKCMNTSDDTLKTICDLSEKVKKVPIVVKDAPGFVLSRLFTLLVDESVRIVEEGIASPTDLDKIVELGLGHPMGPLKISDINNELGYEIMSYLREKLGERYKGSLLMEQMVHEGLLGRKTGKGFYDYSKK